MKNEKLNAISDIKFYVDCVGSYINNPAFKVFVPAHTLYVCSLDEYIYLKNYYKNIEGLADITSAIGVMVEYTQGKTRVNKQCVQKIYKNISFNLDLLEVWYAKTKK